MWHDYIDPAFREQIEITDARTMVVGGESAMRAMTTHGSQAKDAHLDREDLEPLKMFDRYGDLARRHFDPAATLEAMDTEGIDVAAMFPSFGLYLPWPEHLRADLATALARAYNRWIVDFCAHAPRRLVPVAVAPLHDPALAAREVRRAAADGVRGVMVRPNPIRGRPVGHEDHDEFFATMVELGLPVCLHEGTSANVATVGADRFDTWYGRHVASHPLEQMLAVESLIVDGALERQPQLSVGCFESGSGWLAWWLHRLDEHHALFAARDRPWLSRRPSEYFARQCIISTESEDEFVAATVAAVGSDHVVWASDFPHPEALWPHAVDTFCDGPGAALSEHDRAAIFWTTPCAFFGVDTTPPVAVSITAESRKR